MTFPLALDEGGWKKAGVQTSALRSIPNAGSLRAGVLPQLRLGAFTVPQVPGVLGAPVAELEKGLDVDLDGLVGSGLLATFRVTLVDGGRTMWLEDLPPEALMPAPKLPDLPDPGDVPDDEPEDEPAPAKPGAPKPPLGKPPAPPAPGAKPTGVAPKPPVAPPPMPPPAPKAGGNAPPATPKGTAP